jgi:tRNA nucleotidyltransferase (CCA-adding enzyme)
MNVHTSQFRPGLLKFEGELSPVNEVLALLRAAGGRPFFMGGCVRDALLGIDSKDFDIEVFGLSVAQIQAALSAKFEIISVGAAFGVIKLKDLPVDVSVPRRENRIGAGHRDFEVFVDSTLTPREAAERRDFTINAIGWNEETGELLDFYDGERDLRAGVIRHVSAKFAEDPLRVLRAMQFAARFEFTVAPETVALCASLHPHDLPAERLYEEWTKLILKGRKPSLGLNFLRECGWLQYFPELAAIVDVPQDPVWHPEGCVWTHTLHCMDAFAKKRTGETREDLVVGFAVLCHDLGKAVTTVMSEGRWRALGHEEAGVPIATKFMARLTREQALIEEIVPHVANHDKPSALFRAQSGDNAVRRLALRVGRIDRLLRVDLADRQGRPPQVVGDTTEHGAWLMAKAQGLNLDKGVPKPIMLGRHLVARGLKPGKDFKRILDAAFEAQLEGRFSDEAGGGAWLDARLADEEFCSNNS